MKLTESIIQIQEKLTSSYFQIGNDFQSLKKEVEISLKESENIVHDFRSSIESDSGNSMKKIISQMESSVIDAARKYKSFSNDLITLFNKLNESFEIINKMNKPIEQIIDSAEMMELFALNSMVVAIQAGKHGGGFTYITEELQKNAKSTLSLTKDIDLQRNTVIENYNLLKEKTDGMIQNQKESGNLLDKTLDSDFNNVYKSIEESIVFFEKINNDANNLKPMVLNIMAGLQNQDIIRQSLDHVVLSISEIEKTVINSNEEEDIIIKNKLLELCIYVIDEVIENIKHDLSILSDTTDSIEKHLYLLENNKNSYSHYHIESAELSGGLLSSINKISDSFLKLMDSNDNNYKFEKNLIETKNTLYSSFKSLNDLNKSFESFLDLFRNIIVMARIEIARQSAIQKVEISIKNIYGETVKIFDSVKEIENINTTINSINKKVEKDLLIILRDSNIFNNVFKDDINKLVQLCEKSTNIIIRIISSLKFLTDNYINSFKNIRNEIITINTIIDNLVDIKKETEFLYQKINIKYKAIDSGKTKEFLNNGRLKDLLNKFTIYRHKGKLLDMDMDTESDSVADSSVTLF